MADVALSPASYGTGSLGTASVGYAQIPVVKAQKPRRGVQFWLGILLLLAGVAIGGVWVWNTFGTTWHVQAAQEEVIADFVERLPQEVVVVPETVLYRDFVQNPPPVLDMKSLALGETFGLLTVPTWQNQRGVRDEVLHNRIAVKQGGFSEAQTNRILNTGAAAHYTETAGPGEIGNFSLSAHRRSYGDNFLHLPDLVYGDFVLLETEEAWYIYRVIGTQIVLPTDTTVINPDPFSPVAADGTQMPTQRLMTLTTCTGANGSAWRNTHRWIVHTELDAWMPRSAGIPPMIDQYWEEVDGQLGA